MLAGAQQGEIDRAEGAPTAPGQLGAAELLAIAFRANKKALLWDGMLAYEPL